MSAQRKPFYGHYALGWIHILVVTWTVLGILITVLLQQAVGIALLCFGAYVYLTYWIGMILSRPGESYDLSWILQLRGNERALDAGCGLGRVTVGVAKLLSEGKVIGIDIWDKLDIGGISPQRAYQNAEIEGVRDRVEFKTGNVLDIPFPDGSFDLVTASTVLLALWSKETRLRALAEMHRVLRPGGKLLLMETLRKPWTLIMCPGMAWRFLSKRNCVSLLGEAGFVSLKESYRDIMGYFLVEKSK